MSTSCTSSVGMAPGRKSFAHFLEQADILDIQQLVGRIHDSPAKAVLAIAGGGSSAISMLLSQPGASRTVLEAVVPYSEESLVQWLSTRAEHFCDEPTSRAMAMVAFQRARRLAGTSKNYADEPLVGLGCTASLASDRPKKGPHRAHVSLQTAAATTTHSIQLAKGARTRSEEETLVAHLVINTLASGCKVNGRLDLQRVEDEQVETLHTEAPSEWQDLLLGGRDVVSLGGTSDERPQVIFPGAFNPLHEGHQRMAQMAAEILDSPVRFELSIFNPDKPPLDYTEIARRAEQFSGEHSLLLTRAATFAEKADLFPGVTFVVGADTIVRIAEPRYYGNDPVAASAAIDKLAGCRFLVFGRVTEGGFQTLDDLILPESLRLLCQAVSKETFRKDISSTEMREIT